MIRPSLHYYLFFLLLLGLGACGQESPTDTNPPTIALEEIQPRMVATKTSTGTPTLAAAEVPTEMDKIAAAAPSAEVTPTTTTAQEKQLETVEKAPEAPQKKKKKVKKKRPKIKFDRTTYYFGLIEEGEAIATKFFFDNVGDAPLLIKNASATCGCTYPGYPFEPIKPGERSYISVRFNSKGKFGKQKPVVTLTTNASSKPIKLYLEGEVKTEAVDN